MSARSVSSIRRAAKKILSDNRQAAVRARLRGSLLTRQDACKRAGDVIALCMLNQIGREWGGRSVHDSLVSSLRATSTDIRSSADARIDALEKLCVLDGLMSVSILGDGAQDQYIQSLIAPAQATAPEAKPELSPVAQALKKWEESHVAP